MRNKHEAHAMEKSYSVNNYLPSGLKRKLLLCLVSFQSLCLAISCQLAVTNCQLAVNRHSSTIRSPGQFQATHKLNIWPYLLMPRQY